MSTLFTVKRSLFNAPALYEQLMFAGEQDAILLLEDGVLALQSPIALASFLAKCGRANIDVYALRDDCVLRGVDNQYSEVELIDYSQFVGLVVKHDKQLSW